MDGLENDAALIRALVRYSAKTPAEVARAAKLAASTINRHFNGTAQTRLSQSTLEKLQAAYPSFSGWPKLGANETRLTFNHPDHMMPPRTSDTDTVELEQIDLRYGMGGTFADGPVEVERRPFSREWLRSITSTAPRHLFWAIGDGDSMEPTIRSGEVILIDRSQDTPRMDDGIWAVTHGEIGMIKRLRHRPDGTVELHSDNHLVRPQTAVDGELHVIGRVIAVVRRL
ncbi:S24 family peptidase [Erythrobacter sp.]|uniref:S24 family peptidase n=1 Tax=Erythrobacter sp. TaxID=1042 RepID=UPI0025E76234|nr:S24 family peptidase [Erythrobacter sp.]